MPLVNEERNENEKKGDNDPAERSTYLLTPPDVKRPSAKQADEEEDDDETVDPDEQGSSQKKQEEENNVLVSLVKDPKKRESILSDAAPVEEVAVAEIAE